MHSARMNLSPMRLSGMADCRQIAAASVRQISSTDAIIIAHSPGGCTVRVIIMASTAKPTATGADTQFTLSGKMLRQTQPTMTDTNCPPALSTRRSCQFGLLLKGNSTIWPSNC